MWPKMYKVGLIVSFLLIMNGELAAQEEVTTTDVLTRQLANVKLGLAQLDFLANGKQDMPLLKELEFRSETDEWDPGQQEYGFRLNFNGRGMRATQRSITAQRKDQYALQQELLLEDRLLITYQNLIAYHYAQQRKEVNKADQEVLSDKKKVYEKMLASAALIEIEDLLKTERDVQRMERKLLRTDQVLTNTRRLLGITQEANFAKNWITLSRMEALISRQDTLFNLAQSAQEQKIREAELEREMEDQEGKQLLNFLSVKQAGRERLNFGQEFSIGFGLNIPLKSNNRTKRNEAILEVLDEEQQLAALNRKLSERINFHLQAFGAIVAEYRLLENLIADSQLEEMLTNYASRNDVHPLNLLRIKESILDDRRSLLDLEEKACIQFLEVLYYRGQLSTPTRLNYLSEQLEEIQFDKN